MMLRIRTFGYFATLLVLAGCGGTPKLLVPAPAGEAPQTVLRGAGIFTPAEPVQVVLRSPDERDAFLMSYPVDPFAVEERINPMWWIDYRRHMVVGIALGEAGGSEAIRIDSVRFQEDSVVVYSTQTSDVVHRPVSLNPVHFVVVPKSYLPVVFEKPRFSRRTR